MGEELPHALPGRPPRIQSRQRNHSNTILGLVAVSSIVFWALFSLQHGLLRHFLVSKHVGGASSHGRIYDGEHIYWNVCGHVDGKELECSSIDIPMDHFNKERSGNKTFSIPLIRLRGKTGSKNLLLNPGGPGVSGVASIYKGGGDLQKIVGDNFHLLSFDPRGVNGSRPQAVCYPDQATRNLQSTKIQPADAELDGPELYAWVQNFVKACADTMGEHGRYVNSPQTAADMNSILDAVGQAEMFYWGFSYGTILGQTYATMFPERSKRVIIDGVVNQFDWYEELVELGDFKDSDDTFNAFLAECAEAGAEKCALAAFGHDKDDLARNITSFMNTLKGSPIPVYVNSTTYGVVDYAHLWLGTIFKLMYTPVRWQAAAEMLAQLLGGNGTEALLTMLPSPPTLFREHSFTIHLNDAQSGASLWPQQRDQVVQLLQPLLDESTFSMFSFDEYLAKSQWLIPKTHSFVPRRGFETLHPLLILSTKYDPICPLASAKVARESFVDSRLVQINGCGHCSFAVVSECVNQHVRAYLTNGTLPEEDGECEVDIPNFVDAKTMDVMAQEGDVRAAQIRLAANKNWPQLWE